MGSRRRYSREFKIEAVRMVTQLDLDKLRDRGFTISMSRKGDCWDNAPMESFFFSGGLPIEGRSQLPARLEQEAVATVLNPASQQIELTHNAPPGRHEWSRVASARSRVQIGIQRLRIPFSPKFRCGRRAAIG